LQFSDNVVKKIMGAQKFNFASKSSSPKMVDFQPRISYFGTKFYEKKTSDWLKFRGGGCPTPARLIRRRRAPFITIFSSVFELTEGRG